MSATFLDPLANIAMLRVIKFYPRKGSTIPLDSALVTTITGYPNGSSPNSPIGIEML